MSHFPRLRLAVQALVPILAVAVIAAYFVTQHNAALARSHQNLLAAVAACNAAHDSSTTIITAVSIAIVRAGPRHDDEVRFISGLQAAIDKDYAKCLAKTR